MIVLVDENQKTITICDEEVLVYRWSDLAEIANRIENENVVFVTEAQVVPGNSVVELISGAMGVVYNNSFIKNKKTAKRPARSFTKYYHATTNGQLIVRCDDGDIIFHGVNDFKTESSLPRGFAETNEFFKTYLRLGKIELVDENRKSEIQKEFSNRKSILTREDSIDSLLVKDSDSGSAEKLASGVSDSEGTTSDDSIDLSDGTEEETEMDKNLRRLGIEPAQ